MAKKPQTNEQMFKSLFKDLDTIEVGLLRERVVKIMEMTKEDLDENPKDYNFVGPTLVKSIIEKVEKHLGYKD